MLKSSLCDYSVAYILGKWTITINGKVASPSGKTEAQKQGTRERNEGNKGVSFKNCLLLLITKAK